MAMTYNYDTGKITRDWVLKIVNRSCKRDPDKTVMVGVMCKTCPFYGGIKNLYKKDKYGITIEKVGTFIFCKYHKEDDDVEGVKDALIKMYDEFREEAITHYYD